MRSGTIIAAFVIALVIASIYSQAVRWAWKDDSQEISPTTVFIVNRHNFTQEEILSLNSFGHLTTVSGTVAVLHTDASSLQNLENLRFIAKVENSHPLKVQLDKSVPAIGADEVWRQVKDRYGRNVTGAGVVIGFVDTGIDLSHPDFKFANGTTKILDLWDQTISGHAPTGFDYGYECASVDINSGLCPEFDSFGHGTHVAGIAASTGLATSNYTGIAPGARIIFVKSGQPLCEGASWTFNNAQILDGVNYIIQKSRQLGLRAVISLSLGGNIGGHDGSDPLEQALDAFVEEGTPIVVAAGNEAKSDEHIVGQLAEGSNVTFQVEAESRTTDLQIDIWHSFADSINATLTTPNRHIYSIPTEAGTLRFDADIGKITTTSGSSDLSKEAYFEVNSTNSLPGTGWHVTLTGNHITSQGVWNAWVDAQSCSFPPVFFLPGSGYSVDSHDTIDIPGTARNIITVGAYVTKTTWKGIDNHTYGSSDTELGEIASFSSLGPTRDDRIKPDLVAPGMQISSARSHMISVSDSDPDVFHRILAGTSMAAPHVAGVIALMLQYSPNLQPTQIVELLKRTARPDSFTGIVASGSATWGFGKLDAMTATGFYRLTIVAQNLPATVRITVSTDCSSSSNLTGGSWLNLYFLKGESHAIAIKAESNSVSNTRYLLINGRFLISTNLLLLLKYETQYFIEITAPYGSTTKTGWYDSKTTLPLTAPTRIRATGLLGSLGGEYVSYSWISGDGEVTDSKLIVDQPEALRVLYVLVYPTTTCLGTLTISTIALTIAVKRRNKPAEPSQLERDVSSQTYILQNATCKSCIA